MFSDLNLQLKIKKNLHDGLIKRLQLDHQLHQIEAKNRKLTDELAQSKRVNHGLAQQMAQMEEENRNLTKLNLQMMQQHSSHFSTLTMQEWECSEKMTWYFSFIGLMISLAIYIPNICMAVYRIYMDGNLFVFTN